VRESAPDQLGDVGQLGVGEAPEAREDQPVHGGVMTSMELVSLAAAARFRP
jgi:hypothetical protein